MRSKLYIDQCQLHVANESCLTKQIKRLYRGDLTTTPPDFFKQMEANWGKSSGTLISELSTTKYQLLLPTAIDSYMEGCSPMSKMSVVIEATLAISYEECCRFERSQALNKRIIATLLLSVLQTDAPWRISSPTLKHHPRSDRPARSCSRPTWFNVEIDDS
jgi:hypothetical protein